MAMEENMDTMHERDLDKKWMGLWEEHVAWTRLTIISLVDIKDPTETIATENRLLRNTKDMAELCRTFYGEQAATKFDELMTEHLTKSEELDQEQAEKKNTCLYNKS